MLNTQANTQLSSTSSFLLTALLILVSSLPIACNKEIKVNDNDIVYISCEKMQKELDKNQSKKHPCIIVDPRSPNEYMLGHIENAINIPLPQAHADDPQLNEIKIIFVYGRFSEDILAKAMCKKLLAFGYERVKMYKGGLEEWKARQLPVKLGNEN